MPIILTFFAASVTLVAAVLCHLFFLACARRRRIPQSWEFWGGAILTVALSAGLWIATGTFGGGSPLRISSLMLFLSGVLLLIDLRSLLSRGYSARILVDLLEQGGSMELDSIERRYGAGKGIGGLLERRWQELRALGLVQPFDGQSLRLTRLGRYAAEITLGLRALWCFRRVG